MTPHTPLPPEPQERRRSPMISKVTAATGTVSLGFLISLMWQVQVTNGALSDMRRQQQLDQSAVATLAAEVRGLNLRIQEAIPAWDRRLIDMEGQCRSTRADLGATQTVVATMPTAWRGEIAAAQNHVLEQVHTLIAQERLRLVPQSAVGAGRIGQIAAACARVPADQPGAWTESGRPTVAAVKHLFGGPVTAGEVDAAWGVLLGAANYFRDAPQTADTVDP